MNRRILCVDDEEAILKALRLHVRKVFEMSTANSGAEGLEVFEKEGPFSVVTAEMRMPGISNNRIEWVSTNGACSDGMREPAFTVQ